MTIKLIPEKFTKYGQVFTCIKETMPGFIYARTDEDGIICYEVFERRLEKMRERKLGDRLIIPTHDMYVRYPNDECFGKWAWCCKTLDRAEEILEGLKEETPAE